ncbi:unnamed protein product [Clavelina lepadiformis]|uniref:ethanolamine kinase n=1 Tax=Clavelina lepadiformis TaxID=159417 RepID=A0ABP0GJM5_CLALP
MGKDSAPVEAFRSSLGSPATFDYGYDNLADADIYEIRYTYDQPSALSSSFSSEIPITSANLVLGDLLTPSVAKSAETFVVDLNDFSSDRDLLIQSEIFKEANMSNFVSFQFCSRPRHGLSTSSRHINDFVAILDNGATRTPKMDAKVTTRGSFDSSLLTNSSSDDSSSDAPRSVTGWRKFGLLYVDVIKLPHVHEDLRLLAGELARVHSIPTKGDPPPKPTAFPLMRKFLAIAFASDSIIDGGLTVARKNEEQVLRKEVDELESCLTNLNSPIVFCHNDILLHNVIYNEHTEKISFIDYEYAGFNYQAYDIGNHFCEFAGIDDVDYNLYPGKDFQLKWLRHYLNAWYQYNFPDGCTDTSQMDDKVDILYKQVNKFALASHLTWGIWALVQAKYSTIDFDYKEYSKLRLDEYHRRKDDFLTL